MEPVPAWPSLGAMLSNNAVRYGDRTAVVDGDRRLTYRELLADARALAKALISTGVGQGDLVACWAPNSLRWVVLAHAIWMAGGIIVPISSRLKVLEAGPLLEHSGASHLFTVGDCASTRFVDSLRSAYGPAAGDSVFAGLPSLRHLVRLDLERAGGETGIGYNDFVALGAAIDDTVLNRRTVAVAGGDISEIIFTSGTTGAPKGVQLTHAQMMRAYWDWSGIGGLNETDVYLVITPFSHGFGLNAGVIASALRGMCMVLLDIFEPARALGLIREHGVSVMGGPPNLFARLMDEPGVADNPPKTLRVAFVGAASVPVEILRRIGQGLGVRRVINAYGLMEACVVSMTRADDTEDVTATTTGRALPGVEVRVVDDENRDVADGESGEILVRGYGVMPGYWHDPAQTRSSLTGNGWFHTGDIGVRDAAGNIRIVDRKKDMFICGGFNAYPAEIEDLLLKMGGIATVSVVGVPDSRQGEVGVAFVVPARGSRVEPRAVTAWAKENLAGYKVPRRVFVRDALPLNGNGKVMKDVLRREAADAIAAG
jgi:acyl-CoA synthetase (AMP-forming)/AMP-acid ligase II